MLQDPKAAGTAVPISRPRVRALTIPTDQPEADGTIAWDKTTMVLVEIDGGGHTGIGYSYVDGAAGALIEKTLANKIEGEDAFGIPRIQKILWGAVRNSGRSGIAACAIAAIDLALWDLKAKLLGVALATLLGRRRARVPIYGSGGFTTYTDATLAAQFQGWIGRDGCQAVKMKVGSDPEKDPARIAAARAAIGDAPDLFIDANGAFTPRQALELAHLAVDQNISWFEEPVSSDDLPGLAQVRAAAGPRLEIAAGEYAFSPFDVRAMLAAGAVDVQQADATRIGGVTGFLAGAALCDAASMPLSGHCAPSMHLHVACAAPRLRHLEWFHDHVRIEQMLFDGAPVARDGHIEPDLSRPGHGIALKEQDAARYEV